MSKKTRSASTKAQLTAYKAENRAAKNKARKLEKHLRNHPNDIEASKVDPSTLRHSRKPPAGKKVEAKQYGIQIVGEKTVVDKRTGNKVKVPEFKLVLPFRANGFISNELKNAKGGHFFKVAERKPQ
jgi:hypothetical protein